LFGKRPAGPSPQDLTLAQVQAWAQSHRDLGVRVYRTAAGLRCLITNQLFDPTATETVELLRQAGSDPLYVRLCHAQSCFRARLTPKPWRCGASTPPVRYPWSGSDQEALFCRWQAEYEQAAGNYSVCRLVGQTGPSVVHPDIQPLVSLHDRFTCGPVERELA